MLKRKILLKLKILGSKLANLGFGKFDFLSDNYYLILEKMQSSKNSFVDFRDYSILINPDEFVGRQIYNGEFHEEELAEAIKDNVSKGDMVVELGGHIGAVTIIFRENIGEEGKLHVFEPEPENFSMLKKTIIRNDFSNVYLQNCAVSNSEGHVMISICSENTGSSSIKQDSDKMVEVKEKSAKQVVRNLESDIDWLKIDIKGAELEVIEDIKNEIGSISGIFIELHPSYLDNEDIETIYSILDENGIIETLDGFRLNSFSDLMRCLDKESKDFIWYNEESL